MYKGVATLISIGKIVLLPILDYLKIELILPILVIGHNQWNLVFK